MSRPVSRVVAVGESWVDDYGGEVTVETVSAPNKSNRYEYTYTRMLRQRRGPPAEHSGRGFAFTSEAHRKKFYKDFFDNL